MFYFICIWWFHLHFISGIRYIFMKLLQLFSPKGCVIRSSSSGNGCICCLYDKVIELFGSLSYRQRCVEFWCTIFDLCGKFGPVGFFLWFQLAGILVTSGADVFDMMIKTGLWSLPPSWFVTLRIVPRSMFSVAIAMSGELWLFHLLE